MNLNVRHGTQSKEQDVRDVWGYNPEELKREMERLKAGAEMEAVEDAAWPLWMWKNASDDLKNFAVKIKGSQKIDWCAIDEMVAQEAKVWAEERETREREEEMAALRAENTQLKAQKVAEQDRAFRERVEKELLRRRAWNGEKKSGGMTCYKCGKTGHVQRDCGFNKSVDSYIIKKRKSSVDVNEDRKSQVKDNRNDEVMVEGEKATVQVTTRKEEWELEELKRKYGKVLVGNDEEIEYCTIEKCKIPTPENRIVVRKGQTIPQAILGPTMRLLENMEKRKIIRRSESKWRNPIRALDKGDGVNVRIVSNLMALNDLVEKDPYGIPNIRDVIRATQGSKWFTVLDLKDGFYHIEIEEADKHKTAFEIDGRVYEWNSMVMGYKNAPQIFQRVMNKVLGDMKGKGVEIYIDDIVVHAQDAKRHDELVERVLKRLEMNKMKVNPAKIQWKKKEIMLLGVRINGTEQEASEIKRNEALEYPSPKNIGELRRFLGMTGWFNNFIQDYARKTEKLSDGLRGKGKSWKWSEEMQSKFENMKKELTGMKKLLLANYDKEFMLRTDASDTGLGAVLLQKDANEE